VASIYGTNFDFMPELKRLFGYPFAIMLMIASAVLPYMYFKKRGMVIETPPAYDPCSNLRCGC
jgi:Mg2+ and Co2+ transporter CorA